MFSFGDSEELQEWRAHFKPAIVGVAREFKNLPCNMMELEVSADNENVFSLLFWYETYKNILEKLKEG